MEDHIYRYAREIEEMTLMIDFIAILANIVRRACKRIDWSIFEVFESLEDFTRN